MKLSLTVGIVLASVATLMFILPPHTNVNKQHTNSPWPMIDIVPEETTSGVNFIETTAPTDDTRIDPDPELVKSSSTIPTPIGSPTPFSNCVIGGCSGQLCTDRPDMMSTCEWRPEYACYQSATCERQPSGRCGWTETPELRACLTAGGETI